MSSKNKFLRGILPVLLVGVAVLIGGIIIKTTQKPAKQRPQRSAYTVEVMALQAEDQPVRLHVTGTVMPATELTLRTKVAGEIIEVSPEFIEGGTFRKGDLILRIDPVDYRLAIEQKKAALANAEYQLKLEEGQSDIAAREWELLKATGDGSEADRELALRIPHLKYARAQLAAARAELEKAELDLTRTEVRAPFDAVVISRSADLGAQASVQDTLATLARSDQFHVRASVPVDQLRWMTCDPEKGSLAVITRNSGGTREGRAIRLESAIEEMGRMARVIIGIEHPLQGESPLLLNEYVRITIEGSAIEQAYEIPRTALHDDRFVWLATPEKTLEIRDVEVAWRNTETVILTGGVKDDDRLVLTKLSTPINGMNLRIAGEPDAAGRSDGAAARPARGPKPNE